MSKIIKSYCSLALSLCLVFPFVALADNETQEVKASVAVSAVVPTTVCAQYSSIVSNVSEILSDGSQKVTFTVVVKSCSENPIEDAVLELGSNRGAIDKVNQVDEDGNIITSGDGQGVTGTTDANGYIFFQAYSAVAGKSTFTAIADGQLTIGQVQITFLTLPTPHNVDVVVEVPDIISSTGEITLFRPGEYDIDEDTLVNTTMKIIIPIWVFYGAILLVLVDILMFLTIIILILKVRKRQKTEITELAEDTELLKKEAAEIEQFVAKEKEENK